MRKSEVVRARIEPYIKQNTDKILSELGLSNSEAISVFYHQIFLRKGLPFDVRIPNETTISAINSGIDKVNLSKPLSLDQLKNRY
jgi:DNA-damage-inducible protein J